MRGLFRRWPARKSSSPDGVAAGAPAPSLLAAEEPAAGAADVTPGASSRPGGPSGSGGGRESSEPQSLMQAVWPLLGRYRGYWLVVLVAMPVSAVMAMLVPYLTKRAIDEYILPAATTGQLDPVWNPLVTLAGMMGAVVIFGYIADALYVALLQRVGHSMIADLRQQLFRRTLRLSRSYFDTHPIGTILTRVTSDFEALQESLATGVLSLFMELLKSIGYITMMFLLDWRLTLVLLLVFPVLAGLVQMFQSRIRYHFFRSRQVLSEATGYLQEALNGMKTVQLFGAERQVQKQFVEKNARFLHTQNRSNLYDALLFSLVEGVTTLSLALMLWYSAGELLAGAITLGVLVAFIEYLQRLFVPVREFSQQVAVLQRALAAMDHINHLFRTPIDPAESSPGPSAPPPAPVSSTVGTKAVARSPAAPSAASPSASPITSSATCPAAPSAARLAGAAVPRSALQSTALGAGSPQESGVETLDLIEFDEVRFRYRAEGAEVLRGVSFTVRRGETLGIVGPTGSGKSSIIRLLTRGYGGYEGSIRINGEELRDISVERLGRLTSVVHQNVFLFQGSVSFNIGLDRPGLDERAVQAAAQYVNAHQFITRLEGGYGFPIVAGGGNLSVGQGQLISLARAVAAQTDLIVLDEATASVDSLTERLIQQALERLYQDKTVIAIAHRLSTIRHADTILVLEQGLVAEQGNHQQLLELGGLYAALVGEAELDPPEPGDSSDPARPPELTNKRVAGLSG